MTDCFTVEVAVAGFAPQAALLAPSGLPTPHARPLGVAVEGGRADLVAETTTGQTALRISPEANEVVLRFRFDGEVGRYPEEIFHPVASRFTRADESLLAEVAALAAGGPDDDPLARARWIACGVAERFTYGHPETRFNDGFDHVPALGCGMTKGSCVDINTYFLAALRAAGIEAGYVAGPFYPAEKRDWCEDMHCWVVTRIAGATQEWDIAHHLKLGTRNIRPGLNPKPGFRAALSHSMGLDFPALSVAELKRLSDPVEVLEGRVTRLDDLRIRLAHPALAA